MPGTALQNFNDFMSITGPSIYSGPGEFLNEAVKQTYSFSRFLKGANENKNFQGGDQIKDYIMFDESTTAQNYQPNAAFTWSQPQVVTEVAASWRFTTDHMSWTDQEIELNINGGANEKVQYKQRKNIIRNRMWTSLANFLESKIWADPQSAQAQMETASGLNQYSIPAFITEDTTDYHPNGWTTILTVDPATQSKWRNQVSTYDYDDPADTSGNGNGLIDAFDSMYRKVKFIPPNFHKEAFEKEGSRYTIFCSGGGLDLMKRLLRDRNDTLVKKQDAAYPRPQFDGIDLEYVAYLDTATIDYPGSGTSTTELNATPDGYRYWFVDHEMLLPFFHTKRYFYGKEPYFLPQQPWTWVQPTDLWWNLWCRSRQRLGIIAPSV